MVVLTSPGLLACKTKRNLTSSSPYEWSSARPRLLRVSGWMELMSLLGIPKDLHMPWQSVTCDFRRSELPSPGTWQSFPKQNTSQLPSKRGPLGQLFLKAGVWPPLGAHKAAASSSLWGEHLGRLHGNRNFRLFLWVKRASAFWSSLKTFKIPFHFFFLTSVAEVSGLCRQSFSPCVLVRQKDSFQQEGETRGSYGGSAPHVGPSEDD